MKLNVGGGRRLLEGYLNVDLRGDEVLVDVTALPFREGTFDEVFASHILEHVPDLEAAKLELHRITRLGGLLRIVVPYGLRSLHNPPHYHAFDLKTLDVFCEENDTSLQHVRAFRLLRRFIISDYKMPLK